MKRRNNIPIQAFLYIDDINTRIEAFAKYIGKNVDMNKFNNKGFTKKFTELYPEWALGFKYIDSIVDLLNGKNEKSLVTKT